MYSTSETMWVDSRTRRFSASSLMRLRKRMRSLGSRPAVGSSRMRILGSLSLGDARPALHAAGELFHFLPPDLGEPHLLQQVLHPLPGGGRAQALDGGDIEQIVLDREVGVVAKVLGQIPQQISIGAAQGEDVLPVPGDGPRGGGEEGAEHPHEGGFAGAVDAQQAVDTGVHGVGQVVYGGKG